jgi:hypothetical protein
VLGPFININILLNLSIFAVCQWDNSNVYECACEMAVSICVF